MSALLARLPVALAALWWGGVSGVSFLAVPVLFAQAGDPALAGRIAARLFSLQSAAVLLIVLALLFWPTVRRERGLLVPLGIALLVVLLQELAIAPRIVSARAAGESIRLWHSLGTVCILAQWLSGALALLRLVGLQQRPGAQPASGGRA